MNNNMLNFVDYRWTLSYNYEVIFEWDEKKAKSNLRKHKISFGEAETVFEDALSVTISDPDHSIEENRFIDIGTSDKNHLLVVSYTERDERFRIISTRKANKAERKIYEEN